MSSRWLGEVISATGASPDSLARRDRSESEPIWSERSIQREVTQEETRRGGLKWLEVVEEVSTSEDVGVICTLGDTRRV